MKQEQGLSPGSTFEAKRSPKKFLQSITSVLGHPRNDIETLRKPTDSATFTVVDVPDCGITQIAMRRLTNHQYLLDYKRRQLVDQSEVSQEGSLVLNRILINPTYNLATFESTEGETITVNGKYQMDNGDSYHLMSYAAIALRLYDRSDNNEEAWNDYNRALDVLSAIRVMDVPLQELVIIDTKLAEYKGQGLITEINGLPIPTHILMCGLPRKKS